MAEHVAFLGILLSGRSIKESRIGVSYAGLRSMDFAVICDLRAVREWSVAVHRIRMKVVMYPNICLAIGGLED